MTHLEWITAMGLDNAREEFAGIDKDGKIAALSAEVRACRVWNSIQAGSVHSDAPANRAAFIRDVLAAIVPKLPADVRDELTQIVKGTPWHQQMA